MSDADVHFEVPADDALAALALVTACRGGDADTAAVLANDGSPGAYLAAAVLADLALRHLADRMGMPRDAALAEVARQINLRCEGLE